MHSPCKVGFESPSSNPSEKPKRRPYPICKEILTNGIFQEPSYNLTHLCALHYKERPFIKLFGGFYDFIRIGKLN